MKKIIYIFIGCLLLTSCSGMLDIESHSAVSPGSVTPQDLSALRMGMYNKLWYLQTVVTQCFVNNKSEIWS